MKAKTRDDFLMSPTVDYCFKELLAYPEIRKGFVAAILNQNPEKIAETTLMPTILGKDTENGKYGILDVRIKMKSGTQMDLEMQVAPFKFWDNRVIFYLSKMYTDQIKEGQRYEDLKPCIHVSILNFNLFSKDQICFREIAFCDLTTKEKYTDLMEIYVLELKNFHWNKRMNRWWLSGCGSCLQREGRILKKWRKKIPISMKPTKFYKNSVPMSGNVLNTRRVKRLSLTIIHR